MDLLKSIEHTTQSVSLGKLWTLFNNNVSILIDQF